MWVVGSCSLVVFWFNTFNQGLLWKIRAVSDIGQKGHILKKRALKIPPPQIQVFLQQNKALNNFHKRGKCPIAGSIKNLD